MKPNRKPLAVFLAALSSSVIPVIAATGTLDTTFGTGGSSTISFGGTETANAVAVMSNGKIVVAGSTNAAGNSDFAVIRYNANGTLDTTFSSDGGTTTDIGTASQDFANAVAVQADGKILVAGYSNSAGNNNFVTVRYNVDGTLDTFFGAGGKVTSDFGNDDRAACITIQEDGKIVVAGSTDGGSSDFAVARYLADGSPDTSFSGDGRQNATFFSADFCQTVAIQNDGKIVLAGYTNNPGTNDFAIARFTADGTLDSTFDTDGRATVSFGDDDRASGVVIQDDGAIVVAGSWDGGDSDMAIARFNGVTGALDTTFSTDGRQTLNFSGVSVDFCNALALQDDGNLLLGGSTTQFGTNDFALARFTPAGDLDLSFGTNGLLAFDLSIGGADAARAIALQSNGKPVITGTSLTDFSTIRLNTIAKADARVGSSSSAPIGKNVFNETGAGQALSIEIAKSGGSKTSFVRIDNKGHEADSFTVGGTAGNSNFTVEYFNGKTNVTNAVKNGTFSTGNLAAGKSFLLKVKITTKTAAAKKKLNVLVTGTSATDTTAIDTVVIKAKSK